MDWLIGYATWANENSGLLLVVLTGVYCVATLALVVVMLRSNKISKRYLYQAEQVALAASRPYVSMRVEIEEEGGEGAQLPFAHLVLQNTGKTQALNVSVTLNPKLSITAVTDGVKRERSPFFLLNEVFSIAPGEIVCDQVGFTPSLFEEHDLPVFKGTIKYRDVLGNVYEEPAEINFLIMQDAVPYRRDRKA